MLADVDFADAVVQAESEAELAMTRCLVQAAPEHFTAGLEWLRVRRPADWRESRELVVRPMVERLLKGEG